MKYIRIIDQNNHVYPYDLDNLTIEYPNTSFCSGFPKESLAPFGIYPVHEKQKSFNKKYSELTPVFNELTNRYEENLIEIDFTSEEIAARIESQWTIVRQIRNGLLKDSDFTMLEDFSQTETKLQECKQYRQALRDVTTQPDPFNITWPIKPV